MPGRGTWTKLEEETRGYEVQVRALGAAKSRLDFNVDFDKVLAKLRALANYGVTAEKLDALRATRTAFQGQRTSRGRLPIR